MRALVLGLVVLTAPAVALGERPFKPAETRPRPQPIPAVK